MYRRMSLATAKSFKKKNKEYNVYHCNIHKANLFRDDDKTQCNVCMYLVNGEKKTIEMSELNDYDVIFITPDGDI